MRRLLCHLLLSLPLLAFAQTRPNILVILADDQAYGDLSLHGNPHLKTPNLDRFATNNIQFEHFYVSPVCAPTRASFLTGRYSLRTGVRGVARGEETMRTDEVTLAEALRGAGYRTGIFGKWHNGGYFPDTPEAQGFDEVFGFNCGHWNNYFNTTLTHNGQAIKTKGYTADVFTTAALDFIRTNQKNPFFCYLAFNTPHSPFQVADKYFDRCKARGLDDHLACVYGMCENIDDNVGRVLAKLDEWKLRDNTIVIYFSDNGPAGPRYNAGMRGLKGTLHEGGTREPFFLSWPARFKTPRKISRIAAHIDLFPTLFDLCQIPLPQTLPLDGRSLVPLLEDPAAAWPDRTLYCQHLLAQPKAKKTGALRTQQYRLVNDGPGWQLFDMEKDPGETTDVSAQHPEIAQKLIADYKKWWAEILPEAQKPKDLPAIGSPLQNPVELLAPDSAFTGGLHFSGRHPNNAWLTDWTNTAAKIEWKINVLQAGQYEVSLKYLCPAAEAGSRVKITADPVQVETVIPGTPIHQVPSPDRSPRDEVYEMEWATLKAGTLTLPKGETTLTVQALNKSATRILDLKSILLRRSD